MLPGLEHRPSTPLTRPLPCPTRPSRSLLTKLRISHTFRMKLTKHYKLGNSHPCRFAGFAQARGRSWRAPSLIANSPARASGMTAEGPGQVPRPARRLYTDARARSADRDLGTGVCGERLRPLVPILVEAMERHGAAELPGTEQTHRVFAMQATHRGEFIQDAPALLAVARSVPSRRRNQPTRLVSPR
jgi:hypothetical protein